MRDIPGYESLYAITSCGRVWSYRAKKFLKPEKTETGYLRVNLCKDGVCKKYRIHRLVAEAYLPNPLNLPQVNHKDEDKSNNALPNLEWISPKDNINYGTGKERSAKSRQNKVICLETGEVFESAKEAGEAKYIDSSGIRKACRGKRKTAANYHWRYYEDED